MSKEVALRETRPISLFPSESEWAMLKEQATMAVQSGFLPQAVNTPEKAIAIALKGRELGIPPMHAFAHIHIIQGKPTISAELMLSLIYKNCPGAVIDYIENGPVKCVIQATRPGSKPATWGFSIEDARKANLLSKGSWQAYPGAMLRARAISIVARAVFPDAIMGCSYTPEELGAEVDDEGDVINIPQDKGAPKTQGTAPAPLPTPKKKDRALVAAEIKKMASVMHLTKTEIDEWVDDLFKKSTPKLSIEEMEHFLTVLQEEAARAERAV